MHCALPCCRLQSFSAKFKAEASLKLHVLLLRSFSLARHITATCADSGPLSHTEWVCQLIFLKTLTFLPHLGMTLSLLQTNDSFLIHLGSVSGECWLCVQVSLQCGGSTRLDVHVRRAWAMACTSAGEAAPQTCGASLWTQARLHSAALPRCP